MSRRRVRRALLALLACGAHALRGADRPAATVPPGSVVRWPGPELVSCEIDGRRWAPLDGACLFPIDLERTGTVELVRRSTAGVASRRVAVGPSPYPEQRLEVEDRYVAPSAEALARIARERKRVAALLGREGSRRFRLPLGAPLDPLPDASRFGARRVFNGQPRSPHSGADFAAATGTPVLAVDDGEVALAEEHYFAGRSVFVDHGDGLLSMSFHLSEIAVAKGDRVRRGQLLGRVGATGRVTGPHLHFGLRWHGARVDPVLLLGRSQWVEIE
jgi:murein DD-endopeptidase MepM/ murein hydrolase activator NlpD